MSTKRTTLEEIAAESVQRSGLHNVSFRTLANEVGVKSSSVHYYFPEKANLASALIENYTEAFCNQLETIGRKKVSLIKKLDAFVKIFEDVLKADKLCLCGMMAAEVSTLDKQNRELLNQYFKQAEKWIADQLSDEDQRIAIDLKPAQLAKVIMSGLEGAILIDRVDGGIERVRAQRDLIRTLIN